MLAMLRKLFVAFVMLMCSISSAFESGTDYNSANMSYTENSTISQIVVFDSSMQSGGTLTFSVEAHAGGGRPLQHDTGQLNLEFYNGATLVGSSTTNYATGNLLQMNSWSNAPGDNSEAWSTLTLTSTNCGSAGSCTTVTHVKVTMVGTDTSWWAGNYGPQWRVPTLTFTPTGGSAGNNILYNPEFGVSPGGTYAQGWTSSTGWGACGTTSGSVMCTTTAAGVTANMSGGGYSSTGGTTSGQAGGYSGTLSVTSFSGSSGGGSPTIVSTAAGADIVTTTTTTGATTTTTTVTNGSTTTATVTTDTRDRQTKVLNINRNVTVTNTTPVTTTVVSTTPVTTTTVTTPTTVDTYSDGSTVTTNGTPVTTTSTTNTVVTTSTTVNDVQVTSTDTSYSTRIDQMDKLYDINHRVNVNNMAEPFDRHVIVNGLLRNRDKTDRDYNVYLNTSKQESNTYDLYSYHNDTTSVGIEKRIDRDLLLGAMYTKNEVNLYALDAGGSIIKDTATLYGLKIYNDFVYRGEIGASYNTFNSHHTLSDLGLSNSAQGKGNDYWAAVRVYTPDMKGFRPFVGVRRDVNRRDYIQETGDSLSAVDYSLINTNVETRETGVRFDKKLTDKWAIGAEVSGDSNDLNKAYASVMYNGKNSSTILLKIGRQEQRGAIADQAQIQLRINF